VTAALIDALRPNRLGGFRAELVAEIPWFTEDRRCAPLPPGLEGAPPDYRMGPCLLRAVRGAEETWVVWYQTGWLSHENLEAKITWSDWPPVARAWPPLRIDEFVLVHARTGDTRTFDDAYMPPKLKRLFGRSDAALSHGKQMAGERAKRWLEQVWDAGDSRP